MNFLAHIYLSGDNDDVRLGNFISDYVKGRDHHNFPPMVQKGILIHRKIDFFTDTHPIVRKHKELFYPKYHKHAGIVTDILYDHFLSHDWHMFSDVAFDEYVDDVHVWLQNNMDAIPTEMKKFIPHFIKNSWLRLYRTIEGIESVLIGMSKGTSLPPEYEFAIHILRKHYNEMKHDFYKYFPELVEYIKIQSDEYVMIPRAS
jgi:acyl carrier protein phosphodiesterase